MEEVATKGRSQLADISIESIGHVKWADEDPDRISFVQVIEEGAQVKLLSETNRITADDGPPTWIKWHIGGQ